MKGWSQRQIAKAKGVARGLIQWRLKIADLSEEVKGIFRGGHHGGHLVERHFREICKLDKTPHHLLICKEIIASNLSNEESHKKFPELKNRPSTSMTQKDIEARIKELLTIEKEGKIAPEALQFYSGTPSTYTCIYRPKRIMRQ